MTYLLDTHAFLWTLQGSLRLSHTARTLIESNPDDLALSHASIWEIAIKEQLGKLRLTPSFADFVREQIEGRAIKLLTIEVPHIVAYHQLPIHHRDPFDRMLVAQVIVEGFTLISHDENLEAYGVPRAW